MNDQSNGGKIMFFTYYCYSKILTKKASRQKDHRIRITGRQQQEIQDQCNSGEQRLCQQGKNSSTRPLLFGSIEKLSLRRKYLRTFISNSVSQKADQRFLQKVFGKVNSNFSTNQFYFANS